jgi:transcription termination/antitermination protein NusG
MSEFKWYVIHVAATSENKVALELRAQLEKAGLSAAVQSILVPKKQTLVMRRGLKVQAEDRILPGYVLIQMICSPEILHVIRRVPRVAGMLGSNAAGVPRPLSEHDVSRFLEQVDRIVDEAKSNLSFEPGEMVKVSDGLFSSMEGIVEEVDLQRSRVKVSIAILGRSTPVDLEFSQVEKIL